MNNKGISISKGNVEDPKGDMEIPFYDYTLIATATNNFSIDNKLGQGGFGPVYKVNIQKQSVKMMKTSTSDKFYFKFMV